jgi:hypothetical protein
MRRSAWLSDDGAKSLLVLMNNDTKRILLDVSVSAAERD